ncbi:MBL fold metallo-hydrolase [Leuconostoc mesenteroides subsp. mesenteroides J18]|uniref:MBL fold metallo-hydrolase n=1 Tax=Leuconostoc mesenteroides TaxID=1245 RepID=UPI000234138C|nr:MBL fold metallo-hydrolase [Leuconostoc mesenteroides]AET31110.1 MBL fold metallo-hydrolase [Leuconostoc mesenteroides subsp. mesenteroides J18]AQU50056.1 MBL fold metallo-hydrolase [Leuconostoc mesenteroides subsp. mesenteroides]KAA8370043.1 MBL fold metallo-hydrolase [Leuconostoc mesenteroides]MBD9364691.1 MBL fold metallo-hydrolase [Leuconostoc mesenteroides]MBZ1508475.1 MBL fold metallo-hydrolase [Leuconostoc mesenteroides]
MKINILVDNNTFIDEYYFGEPALSMLIEDQDEKILFDMGYSDIFLQNAKIKGINLSEMTKIVFSHGHNDHTRGMSFLSKSSGLFGKSVYAHPLFLNSKRYEKLDIGSPKSTEWVSNKFDLNLQKEPIKLTNKIWYLGEIGQYTDFEEREAIGEYFVNNQWEDDYVMDDTAMAYETDEGLFIITGCSHSGICNICEHAKKVTGTNKILGIIGGFHLFDLDERLEKTVDYFQNNNIAQLYPSHCVSFKAKAYINQFITVEEVGVGLEVNI